MESPVFCSQELISCILLAIKKAYIILSMIQTFFAGCGSSLNVFNAHCPRPLIQWFGA